MVELATYPESFQLKERNLKTIQDCLILLESLGNRFFLTFNCDETLCLAVLVLGWQSWMKGEGRLIYYVLEPLKNILDSVPLQ